MPFKIAQIASYLDDYPTVFLGGSITYGADSTSQDKSYYDISSRFVGINTFYHISASNKGINGNGAWENLTRIDSDVIPLAPKVLILDGTANNADNLTDKSCSEALIRKLRTQLPNTNMIAVFFGNYPGWASNNTTNSLAATKQYYIQLCNLYSIPYVDIDSHFAALVAAGTYTLAQLYKDDSVHPSDLGHSIIASELVKTLINYYPSPASGQWSGNIADYTRIFDNGDFEASPIIRTGLSNDGETGTWTTVSTTQRQSTVANSTLAYTGTFKSFGIDANFGTSGAVISYSVDGGAYTNIDLSQGAVVNNLRIWVGERAAHTITFKVISGTCRINRFLAI